MGIGTALMIGGAVLGGTAMAVSAQRQHVTMRRAETRSKGIANKERERQQKAEALLEAQKQEDIARAGREIDRLRGRRLGRRSLLSGDERGIPNQPKPQLGTKRQFG